MRCTRRLFDRAGILAGHAGDRLDAVFDITRETSLLISGRGDGVEAMADFGDRAIRRFQHVRNRMHGSLAAFQMGNAGFDAAADSHRLRAELSRDGINFGGRAGGLFRQLANLIGNNGETAPLFASSCGLDGGVERQQVGLFGCP